MNILDQEFQQFHHSSTANKIELFNRDNHLFDLILSQQLDRKVLDHIYHLTCAMRKISKSKKGHLFLQNRLPHKRAILYFAQPSSRTFLSFESACHLLGIKTSDIRDLSLSSEVKGESSDDTIRTFSSYAHLIVMRHPVGNMAERSAWLLNTHSNRPVPILNGGSGHDQHPTQAMLDIYTLQRSFSSLEGLDGKTIIMCGDLKRGRTVRSLTYLMKNYNNISLIFVAPPQFQMGEDLLEYLNLHQIQYSIESESLKNVLPQADAIYMTRVQDEHDQQKGESAQIDLSNFKLSVDDLPLIKEHGVILHPFPRRDEIDVEVDRDPRAKYWRQERNGMWTRAALIAHIFGVDGEILNYFEEQSDSPTD
ncbi:MAG: aspartate carbamoyltransferase [Bdellovibrionales bacterium]|jgi:aspartate carbamoyltransferase catalytic subunit|nr:aspartate carbamoyltransferase [Bdellovibrionales bacterium]MBT3525010.1 aspartate carbamoyltransferase [Bdellovibrionales bacterium]MBT7765891.1 aspartate carbamoyltransferase [Bdellovibrionales bacterium]